MKILMPAILFLALMGCNTQQQEGYTLRDTQPMYTGHIRLSLAHPFDAKNQDYEILMSVPFDVTDMAVCEVKADQPCAAGSEAYFKTTLIYATPQRRFYKSVASALLEDGLTLKMMSLGAQGQPMDERTIVVARTGPAVPQTGGGAVPPAGPAGPGGPAIPPAGPSTVPPAGPTVPPASPTTPPAVDAAAIKSIVQSNCGGCHAAYAANPDSLKSTGSAGMIRSGSMPKGRSMGAGDKDKLLKFLGG